MATGKIHQQFTGSNYYDTDIYTTDGTLALDRVGSRESNLQFDWTRGQSIEFWLKKDQFITGSTEKEVIFDLWNGEASGSDSYGRLTIFLSGTTDGTSPMRLQAHSGSTTTNVINMLNGNFTTSSIADGNWHHYAVTFKSGSSNVVLKSYVDSSPANSATYTLNFQPVTGALRARIGALITSPSGSSAVAGAGKLSGSVDEFRYWKSQRTEKEIQENYWTQVRGGTNNEVANAELGVYYKFNEGITGDSSTDSTVLDYSGRITNGTWTGYASGARSTGSAIEESSVVTAGTTEYKDPIIYSFHPDVRSLKDELAASGSVHDYENQASVKDSLPSWMVDEDETKANGELKKLTQIVGSYFDTLQLQVERLPFLTDTTYDSASTKPLPFAQRLLTSRGLEAPEIFVDATLLEYFGNRSSDRAYSLDLHEVKNLIYQNIYNNLSYIYKSKGTEKAFRNLIRCYGIGDEIVKFNAYGNNTEFKLEDTFYDTTTRKNYVDFNDPTRFGGIVYQTASSTSTTANGGSYTYVRGTNVDFASTAEVEVIFPRKLEASNPEFFDTSFVSASIFGYHTTGSITDSAFDFGPAADDKNFQLYFVRTHRESRDGYFRLKSRAGDFDLTSSVYSNVYDNQKWNFAVRVRNESWPQAGGITGSQAKLVLDWYGVNFEYGIVKNRFQFTQSLDGASDTTLQQYLTGGRRYYAGADRTNFTGSVVTNSDLRVSSVRHYLGFLENEVIDGHARDPENVGTENPSRNILFTTNDASEGDDNVYIPQAASLGLNWDFAQVTGSDSSGGFFVEDASSGSSGIAGRYPNSNNTGYIVGYQHAGAGYFPSAVSSTNVINKEYVPTAKQRLPEVVNSADSVKVMSGDDEFFPRDAAISQTFFAFEKSMFGVISQEMVDMFGTIVDFNNLIGDIVYKYRSEHKGLEKLRNLFFEKVQNNPDLDKFIDFYKWIDQSLAIFLQQLVPASADVADEIRVMVEDHILGRSSHKHPYPLLDYKGNARWGGDEAKLEARVQGIQELTYDWEHGHAPLNDQQNTNALWWKNRALRSNTLFGTSDSIDSARQSIIDIALSFNSASAETFVGSSGNYAGSTYAIRNFTNTLRLSPSLSREVGGGYNFPRGQKPDAVYSLAKRGDTSKRTEFSAGSAKDIDFSEINDPIVTVKRNRISDSLKLEDNQDTTGYTTTKLSLTGPFALYSSSAETDGYRSIFSNTSNEIVGHHYDSYGDDYEVPMQGPFTEAHVGGNRHRHVSLNISSSTKALDSAADRPEAYFYNTSAQRILANDGTFVNPSTSPQYKRDETAKRPLNIKNIQHTTASTVLGNFSHIYEVVQTSDRSLNNSAFVKAEGFSTASIISTAVTGVVDYTKPTRDPYKHVIVERFSAPGGPEVAGDNQGGAGLDVSSAQFSPYNNINYRNLTVRQPLQTLLTERSERFGLRSGSAVSAADYTSVTASFHKINRNPLQRLETGSSGIVTASTFDNYYVQHMIPRSDYQYAWITASYISSNTNVYGYFPYDGYVSTSAGLVGAINFVSASDLGSGYNGSIRRRPMPKDVAASGFVPTDFAGLNTTIIEDMNTNISNNRLGFGPNRDVLFYYNWKTLNDGTSGVFAVGGFLEILGGTGWSATEVRASSLNNIILHRNGPYGHPTWKQVRVGQGQLARYYRKNNLYTHTPDGGDIIDVQVAGGTIPVRGRYGATSMVTQSVVTSKFKPMVQELQVRTGRNQDGSDQVNTVVIESSFGNSLTNFDNPDFANLIGLESNIEDCAYRQITKLYTNGGLEDPSSPVLAVNKVTYSEVVYPSSENIQTNKVRGRTNYYNNFWRDSRDNRFNTSYDTYRNNNGTGFAIGNLDKLRNSAGVSLSQSVWVLDADESHTTNLDVHATGGIDSQNADGYRSGELQNKYVGFVQRSPNSSGGTVDTALFNKGVLYSRKSIFSRGATPYWQMGSKILPLGDGLTSTASIGRGEAVWDAPTMAGKFDGTSSTFVTKSAYPFYDNYEAYFSDIKAAAQNYSVLPEFRIADHLDFYNDRSSNFLAENLKVLRNVGTPSGSSVPQNSDEDNFFTVFTNSDFMKYFEVVREDHDGLANPNNIKLRCRAIKKFVPYDGFYPAERTIQIATELSSTVSPYLDFIGSDSGSEAAINTFMKPLASPGILFNTIKSGIAVDYPILTGAYNTAPIFDVATYEYVATASYGIFSNSRDHSKQKNNNIQSASSNPVSHNDGWDYRVPFEAILQPEKYLTGKQIVNDEPSIFAGMDVTASWNGQVRNTNYHKMINNFLAETVDFFIDQGQVTKIVSKPQSEWSPMTPGQPYGMRIKIYRSLEGSKRSYGSWGDFEIPQNISGSEVTNFVMYSRPSAFGPPVCGGIYSDPSSTSSPYSVSGVREFGPISGVYCSHTPPYYDGESWIDVVFYPYASTATTASLDRDFNDTFQPTIEDIFTIAPFKSRGATSTVPAGLADALFNRDSSYNARIGGQGTYIRKWRFDQESLEGRSNAAGDSSYWSILSSSGPMAGPWANIWAMQGDASLDIFEREGDSWKIQTKFETPMLNFNYIENSEITTPDTADSVYNDSVNFVTPRGMWHQFGRIPLESEGVYIQVTDIPDRWLSNHPSSSIIHDPYGQFDLRNAISPNISVGDTPNSTFTERIRGYRIPIDGAGASAIGESNIIATVTNKPKSLIDICGFSTEPVKVGKIRETKTIFEAVVAVPFVEEQGERKFFRIPSPYSAAFDVSASPSVARQVEMLKKYVFPPAMDFVHNTEVDPVAMYVFEFSHELDRDDLSHIWQNLSPKIGTQAEFGMSTIEHPLLINEILGDPNKALENAKNEKVPYHIEFPEKLQWMVFKVKQRAKRDYFAQVGKETNQEIPFYSHNWPYDQFSLVELAQIQADVDFGETIKPTPNAVTATPSIEFALKTTTPQRLQATVAASKALFSGLTLNQSDDD